jgi:hypothetical protein
MDLRVGDIVTVKGHGGWATVVALCEDGLAFGRVPKYRATVEWGPSDGPQVGTSKTGRRFPQEFPAGACEVVGERDEEGKLIRDELPGSHLTDEVIAAMSDEELEEAEQELLFMIEDGKARTREQELKALDEEEAELLAFLATLKNGKE